MRRPRRGLILLGTLFVLSVLVIAVPTVELNTPIWDLERGDDENFLGLSLGLDLKGGSHLVYRAIRDDGSEPTSEDLEGVRKILEKRVSSFGLSEPTIQLLGQPADRVLVQLPGLSGATLGVTFEGGGVTAAELEAFLQTGAVGHPEAKVRVDENQLIAEMDELEPAVRDATGNLITESEADRIRRLMEDRFPVTAVFSFAAIDPVTGEAEDEGTAGTTDDAGAGEEAGGEGAATPDAGAAPSAEGEEPADPASPGEDAAAQDGAGTQDGSGGEADGGAQEPQPAPQVPGITTEQIQAVLDGIGAEGATVTEVGDNAWTVELFGVRKPALDDEGNPLPTLADRFEDGLEELSPLSLFATVGSINQFLVGGGVQEAKHLIGQTAQLEFRERICGFLAPPNPGDPWPPDGLSPDEWAAARCTDPTYWSPPFGGGEQAVDIQGSDLTDAFAGTQPGVVGPVVNIEFNSHGSDEFCDVTGRIARPTNQNVVAIYLDGEELVAPSARAAICNGQAFIFGNFTPERARTVAIQLRSGSLPVELELIQERNVDATLGADSLQKSVVAGAVGLVLVLAFVILYYKVPGVVAAIALILYAAVLLALFKLIPVTLTLSGVAALILSIGLAVDANILIAERTKEELRMGRALLASITTGFDRAWPSIRDGNISTIITCIVLFWFGDRLGTSLIQGFALTLGIGVVVSMFTAFFASRVIMRSIAGTALGRRINSFVPVGTVGTDRPVRAAE